MNDRPPRPLASSAPLVVLCLAVLAAFAVMVWAYWPWLEQAIAVEEAPVAWLQSSMLWAGAAVCLVLAFLEPERSLGWMLVAVALFAAALDERFMGHERLKDWLRFAVFHGDAKAMGRIGDLPMLAYAGAGLVLLRWLRRRTSPFAGRRWMIAAVVVGAASIGLDIATDDLGVGVLEEALELLAETLFACGLLRQVQAIAAR